MRTWAPELSSFVVLAFLAVMTLACGSTHRELQSVTLSPATANAQDYPNGQVQFVATGTFNTSPKSVSPMTAFWEVANLDGSQTTDITIDSNGVAACAQGASGTYAVGGWAEKDPSIHPPSAVGPCPNNSSFSNPSCDAVLGTAKLSCP